jgi:hypothetical protein
LFGHVKSYPKENSYPSENTLLDAIHIVLRGVSGITLKATFRNWMDRLVWAGAQEGHDYPCRKSSVIGEKRFPIAPYVAM